ncbi:MAG: hypothetical protein ABH834_06840 [Candidatus Altiarchaeota archaeon]
MTVPCYICCDLCTNYDGCNNRTGCDRCEHSMYGECTHPRSPAAKSSRL